MSNPFSAKPAPGAAPVSQDAPPAPVPTPQRPIIKEAHAKPPMKDVAVNREIPVKPTTPTALEPGPVRQVTTSPDAAPVPVDPAPVARDSGRKQDASLPPLGMEEVTCRTCRFFEFDARERSSASGGECRKHAPCPGANHEAFWPTVRWDAWCGQWELGVSEADMVTMARALAERMDGNGGSFLGPRSDSRSGENSSSS